MFNCLRNRSTFPKEVYLFTFSPAAAEFQLLPIALTLDITGFFNYYYFLSNTNRCVMVSHVVFNGISLMTSKIYSCASLPYIHIPSGEVSVQIFCQLCKLGFLFYHRVLSVHYMFSIQVLPEGCDLQTSSLVCGLSFCPLHCVIQSEVLQL